MVNYKQKYKDQAIVTIQCNDGQNLYDPNLTDNKNFYAVGQKTSDDLSIITRVSRMTIWCTKPNAILNLKGGGSIKIYDDDGSLMSIGIDAVGSAQWTSIGKTDNNRPLKFGNRDTNIQFDDFNVLNGMTQNISDLADKSNVISFNATVTVPSDVTCNYTTGSYQLIKDQTMNVLFDGNIKKGDTITVKRAGRDDLVNIIQYDTDLAFSNLNINNSSKIELIYSHPGEQPPKPIETTTVTFTSADAGIQWENPTRMDEGKNFDNPVIIQKGYELRKPLAIEFTDKNDKTTTLTYGRGSTVYFDGDNTSKNKWNLTINTGYKKLNIKAGQTKLKQYELTPTLQNAKIINPAPVEDDYGKQRYYLDPKHTTITIQANEGYTFENDGSLTYNRDKLEQETLTIKATHTNTVTITLPDSINWAVQDDFMLTMGAVKSEIVETTGGFTNIYKADYTNLLKFSNEVIIKIVGTSSSQSYDVTPYINNLVMLPFNVPTGEKSAVVAGNETFTTQLPTVDNNYLTVDLGKIKVDEQYKNGFDYYQVKTRLMLPFTNMIELDPKHVINQTVTIKYVVNVVNGDTTINLSNGDDLFYSEQVNLASEVPFISSATKGSQYTVINRLKTVFRNSIHQAYIIIEQPTPILNSDYYPTNEKGTLKGYTGNVKASLLNNMDISSNELNALQNLLETGVKIK